jgi:hypothetical protein
MTRVTSDVETLNELFSSGVVTLFGDVFTLLAIMGMMLAIDWRLALVTFSVIPLVWLTAAVFRRRVREAFRDIRLRLARLNAICRSDSPGCGWCSCSAGKTRRPGGSPSSTAITWRRTCGRSRCTPSSFRWWSC